MSEALAIEATDVARRFASNWVLRGVSLTVAEGEVVGLLGANGSGKSTLLRIIATLLRPHVGTVRVFGHDVVRAPHEVRPHVGYLAHDAGLYHDLTARENLVFAARMLSRDLSEVDRVLDRVGLLASSAQQVRGLSAGMQRRLAVARLMLVRPRLLLLDEPYSNLDAEGVHIINSFIMEWTNQGAAALVVLHELAPSDGVLQRSFTMRGGRLEQEHREVPAMPFAQGEHLPPLATSPR